MKNGPPQPLSAPTPQRDRDKLLRDTDSLYLSLVENIPVSVLRKDREGHFVFANQRFCDELGKSLKELVGLTDADLFPADLAEKYRQNDVEVMESGEVFHDIEEHAMPDGSCRYVELFKSPVRTDDGEVTGLQCIYWDVTERHQMEAQLEYERHLLHSLMDHLPDSIYFKDLESRFVRVNKGLSNKFGLETPAAAVGKSDADFFSDEHAEAAREDELQIIESGEPILGIQEKESWNDGRETWCSTNKLPLRNEAGKIIGTFGVSRDITLQKQAERQLEIAKQAAMDANQAKSDFLANMSHEIRTPMNGIIGMTELLMNTELAQEQRDYLGMVKQSADALMRLLNDILDFSKIEAGKFELESLNFNLRDTVTNTVRTLSARAAEKDIELACRIAPEIPQMMTGDPGRLRQIIVNLVGNAIKFTDQGEVFVNVELQAVDEDAVSLKFSVNDTGIGIPKEKQSNVFHAFEQVDASTTRRFGGTGLGLSISSQLVKMMRGEIWLESEVNRGTTFYFTATFDPASEQVSRPLAQLDQFKGMRVLVVDDNKTNRRILEEVLNSWNMQPVMAESGSAGLAELYRGIHEKTPIRLVLLDYMMPGMNGFQFAELVRANPDFDDCVMIMISSAVRAGDTARCRSLNIVRCMAKPVKQSELLDMILSQFDLSGKEEEFPEPDSAFSQETALRTKRILLAEDGLVNQQVAVGFLSQRGHNVTVVENGQLAVEILSRESFDLILMDIQMPVMDGFEATAAIREQEKQTGAHIPIIAMTANAMKGDQEACLNAGMDGYVAKPIDREVLCRLVENVGEDDADAEQASAKKLSAPAICSTETPAAESTADETESIVNWQRVTKKLPGGEQGTCELVELFLVESKRQMKEIQSALNDSSPEPIRRACHTLKSSAGIFECRDLEELTYELEMLACQGDLEKFANRLPELQTSLAQIRYCFEQFLEKNK